MLALQSFAAFAAITGIAYASAVPVEEEHWTLTLLKRQEPGTAAYACHEACGTAITIGRESGAGRCTDSTFLEDYAACLACAGPDDVNIWQYYGRTLTTYGTSCGLSTTPGAGSQSSSAAPAITSAVPISLTTVTPTISTSAQAVTQVDSSEATTIPESTSVVEQSSSSIKAAPVASTSEISSTSQIAYSTTSYTTSWSTGSPNSAGNGSTSPTSVSFTGSGTAAHGKTAGMFAICAAVVFAGLV